MLPLQFRFNLIAILAIFTVFFMVMRSANGKCGPADYGCLGKRKMAAENVRFKIQVGKKLLSQLFEENAQLKNTYEKLQESESNLKALKEEMKRIADENVALRAKNEELEHNRRINEERAKSTDLEETESKLLKMKLRKAEEEKTQLIDEYEKEKTVLEELLRDKSKLLQTETKLEETLRDLEESRDEVKKIKKQIAKMEAENRELDEEKLKLEKTIEELTARLRLFEEKNISNDLEHVESKLLKLKLQTVENEKQYLLEEFERERNIITKQSKPRVAKLEENIKVLRRWIEKEARERRPRDSEEVKFLKAQIQTLENDKSDLIEGFELERKVFQKILKNNGNYNLHLE